MSDLRTRRMGGYPERWKATREYEYHLGGDLSGSWHWHIELRDDLHWVVGTQLMPDDPLIDDEDAENLADLQLEQEWLDATEDYYAFMGEE